MVLYLPDSSPENIIVDLLPGLTINGSKLEQGFNQKLVHREGLKVTVVPYSTETQTVLPKSIYLAGESHEVQVETVSSGERICLVHANSSGKIIHEYQLPFLSRTGEGWILFECDIEDSENNTLLATGYENPPYGPVSTYSINLSDCSIFSGGTGKQL